MSRVHLHPLYTGSYANSFSFTVPLAVDIVWSSVFRYYLKDKRWFLIRDVYASFGLSLDEMKRGERKARCSLLSTMGKFC